LNHYRPLHIYVALNDSATLNHRYRIKKLSKKSVKPGTSELRAQTYDDAIERVSRVLNRPTFWVADLKKVTPRAGFY
jgi:hypothetical protein